jgi:DNA repair protein RadD
VSRAEAKGAAPATASGGARIEKARQPLDLLAIPSDFRPQALTLRPYQAEAIVSIERAFGVNTRALYVAPTGSGKGEVIARVTEATAARGERALVLVHRIELVEQISTALRRRCVEHGAIAPRFPTSDHDVQIAMVATFARRIELWRDRFDLIVIDEAHHAVAGLWGAAIASQPRARIFDVTATPERLDGRGLRDVFDTLIIGPSTRELINDGCLSRFVIYEPMRGPDLTRARIRAGDFATEDIRTAMGSVVITAAVTEYQRLCPGLSAVVFCVDTAHSKTVAERFRAAGVRAAHIDGETAATERRRAIDGLGNGSLDVLCNCDLISEGLDIPAIGGVILLRPTQSLALYLQQVGRALRPARGKDRALILDFAGNVARHGMPDAPRDWSLDAKPRRLRERSAEAPRYRRCTCGAIHRLELHRCSECGADLLTRRERREIEIRLEQARRAEERDNLLRLAPRDRIRWAGADERSLHIVAQLNGYKPGWVWYRLRELRASNGGAA